jgi:hypothetical protein
MFERRYRLASRAPDGMARPLNPALFIYIRVIKERKKRYEKHVAYTSMWEVRSVYKILVGKP